MPIKTDEIDAYRQRIEAQERPRRYEIGGQKGEPGEPPSALGRLFLADLHGYRRYKERFYSRLFEMGSYVLAEGGPVPAPDDGGFPQGEGTPQGRPFASVSFASPKVIGLNAVKSFYYEDQSVTKYGTAESQLDDCVSLGAAVLRQHGVRDIMWSMLSSDPVGTDPATQVTTGDNPTHYRTLIRHLSNRGLKVIFTFLTLGGGADYLTITDPAGEIENVLGLNWDHEAHSALGTVDGYDYEYLGAGEDSWYESTLDVRSGYKRYFIGEIARGAAQLLLNAARDEGVDLADVVAGIEIFNEVELRNMQMSGGVWDVFVSAYFWAKAYLSAARAFRDVLGDSIPILAPGISSYGPAASGTGFSWYDKYLFFYYFVHKVASEASTAGLDPRSYLQGVDYHWYHRREGEQIHIGHLPDEVALLRTILDAVGFTEAGITAFESGVSVTDDPVPTGWSDAESFQAAEVWRRVGGALATHATGAGWHSWMALQTGTPFAGTGLRVDRGGSSTNAGAALSRTSWGAFQRLVDVLGSVTSGHMVLPAIRHSSDLNHLDDDDYLVVLAFYRPFTLHPYVYLVFLDPTAEAEGLTEGEIDVSSAWSFGSASLMATIGTTTDTGGDPTTLPTSTATFDPTTVLGLPSTISVGIAQAPVLVLSMTPLRWTSPSAW